MSPQLTGQIKRGSEVFICSIAPWIMLFFKPFKLPYPLIKWFLSNLVGFGKEDLRI
jgi:hypothetical protein